VRFSAKRRIKTKLIKELWEKYVFDKQVIRELARDYLLDRRTIKDYLDRYHNKEKMHDPRPVHIVVDALYFGERKEHTSWCIVVFRDPYNQENLYWSFHDTETTAAYREGRIYLESLGYTILSVTGDGFGGIKQGFAGIPYQMCLVHMKRLVIKGTTRCPQTEAGQVLLALTESLFSTSRYRFEKRLNQYEQQYKSFLYEKTVHRAGEWSYTHEGVLQAFKSLKRLLPYLFTYEGDENISKNTNSIEGHFRHVEDITAIHCGAPRSSMEKILTTIVHASTIAPNSQLVKKIL